MDKVTIEVAENEFQRYADHWDIDTEIETMDDEDRDSFKGIKRRIIRAICSGAFTVDGSGTALTFTLKYPQVEGLTEIEFNPPNGRAIAGFDKYKDRQNIAKLNAFMGSMAKQNPAMFTTMDGRDLKVCQAVATLFLAS